MLAGVGLTFDDAVDELLGDAAEAEESTEFLDCAPL